MKFTSSILLISAAIASVATAAPLAGQIIGNVNIANRALVNANVILGVDPIAKLCDDCTHKDDTALNVIVKASADHYADICYARLDNPMREIATAKVTSGTEELPKEKILLTIAVQSKIDDAKKACTSEEIVPAIKDAVAADNNLDIDWSKQQDKELEKKMAELEVKVTQLVVDRIQAIINAESLSKDATEKMTNTDIVPAPETPAPMPETPALTPEALAPVPETPAPIPETPAPIPETPAPVPKTPAPVPETPTPAPETHAPATETLAPAPGVPTTPDRVEETTPKTTGPEVENNNNNDGGLKDGIDVAANVDPKYVCKTGCSDSQDVKDVLSLRVNLENELKPRLDHFYAEEVPTAYNEKSATLMDGVMNLLSGLRINANADVKTSN